MLNSSSLEADPPNSSINDQSDLIKFYEDKVMKFLTLYIGDWNQKTYSHDFIQLVRDINKTFNIYQCPVPERVLKKRGIDRETMPLPPKVNLRPKIKTFHKTLNKKNLDQIPVIGFYDDLSAMWYWQDKDYKFFNDFNGSFGQYLYLSFKNKKPIFGNDAKLDVDDYGSFVVYDLIKILSMPQKINFIKVDPKWGFKITSDPHDPILLEFNTYGGQVKHATPEFLMAMMIKFHVKALKEKLNAKPEKLGFYFFNNFRPDELERIERRIEKACNLYNIDFVFC